MGRSKKFNILVDMMSNIVDLSDSGAPMVLMGGFLLRDMLYKSALKEEEEIMARYTVDLDFNYLGEGDIPPEEHRDNFIAMIKEAIDGKYSQGDKLHFQRVLNRHSTNTMKFKYGVLVIEVDIGDEVNPELTEVYHFANPKLEGRSIRASKIETILTDKISAHSNNTNPYSRFKDVVDLYLIATKFTLQDISLREVLKYKEIGGREFGNFDVEMTNESMETMVEVFRKDKELADLNPTELLEVTNTFLQPFKDKIDDDLIWDRENLEWVMRETKENTINLTW